MQKVPKTSGRRGLQQMKTFPKWPIAVMKSEECDFDQVIYILSYMILKKNFTVY